MQSGLERLERLGRDHDSLYKNALALAFSRLRGLLFSHSDTPGAC